MVIDECPASINNLFCYTFEAEGCLFILVMIKQTCWGNSPDLRVESTSWKQSAGVDAAPATRAINYFGGKSI